MGTPASLRLVGERTSSGADEFSCLHGNDRAKLARTRGVKAYGSFRNNET